MDFTDLKRERGRCIFECLDDLYEVELKGLYRLQAT
jgi:hypothetical protein